VAAYSSADIGSDHNPLIGTLRFKGKRIISKNKSKAYDISFLSDRRKRKILKDEFDKHIRLNNNNNEGESMEDQWQNIKNSIHNAFEKVLRYRKFRKEWMTSEILDIEERRFTKGNIQKYITIYTETYIAHKSSKKYMAGKVM